MLNAPLEASCAFIELSWTGRVPITVSFYLEVVEVYATKDQKNYGRFKSAP
jgi:hypothetical protein